MNKIAVAKQKPTSDTGRLAVARSSTRHPAGLMQQVLPEELFVGMLCLERKKAERSQKRLLLVLSMRPMRSKVYVIVKFEQGWFARWMVRGARLTSPVGTKKAEF